MQKKVKKSTKKYRNKRRRQQVGGMQPGSADSPTAKLQDILTKVGEITGNSNEIQRIKSKPKPYIVQ